MEQKVRRGEITVGLIALLVSLMNSVYLVVMTGSLARDNAVRQQANLEATRELTATMKRLEEILGHRNPEQD